MTALPDNPAAGVPCPYLDQMLDLARQHRPDAQPGEVTASVTGWVLRVDSADGPLIVKRHREDTTFLREATAYRAWERQLTALGGLVPAVLRTAHVERTLLLSAVPGRPVSECELTGQEETAAHRAAGQTLATLHASVHLTGLEGAMLPAAAARARLRQWRRDAVVTVEQAEQFAAMIERLEHWSGPQVVLGHGHFLPEHWMWNGSHVSLIGLRGLSARYPALSLLPLAVGVWEDRRDLRAAFLEGYKYRLADSVARTVEAAVELTRAGGILLLQSAPAESQ
ncbi:hypothetical protein Lfu02_15490 [Longispora fulva]|uniref:Aminoglycoside phosphotransferase domain-containing protein n=1 Tax=Longispora fulva TaxID=619741 RepID=A0A8J7GLI4_9ACTN|nr:phosphotransferase [Longispora fulva]MBG6140441.1 hypothetical protein [Longispora fulva]GIG57177.1 hypothetical protein Lfu02_15490 [Longispora fulva]